MMACKGDGLVVNLFSDTVNLYSETGASMDSLEGYSPEVGFPTFSRLASANPSLRRQLPVS